MSSGGQGFLSFATAAARIADRAANISRQVALATGRAFDGLRAFLSNVIRDFNGSPPLPLVGCVQAGLHRASKRGRVTGVLVRHWHTERQPR